MADMYSMQAYCKLWNDVYGACTWGRNCSITAEISGSMIAPVLTLYRTSDGKREVACVCSMHGLDVSVGSLTDVEVGLIVDFKDFSRRKRAIEKMLVLVEK